MQRVRSENELHTLDRLLVFQKEGTSELTIFTVGEKTAAGYNCLYTHGKRHDGRIIDPQATTFYPYERIFDECRCLPFKLEQDEFELLDTALKVMGTGIDWETVQLLTPVDEQELVGLHGDFAREMFNQENLQKSG